jgi:hypothetical protein
VSGDQNDDDMVEVMSTLFALMDDMGIGIERIHPDQTTEDLAREYVEHQEGITADGYVQVWLPRRPIVQAIRLHQNMPDDVEAAQVHRAAAREHVEDTVAYIERAVERAASHLNEQGTEDE